MSKMDIEKPTNPPLEAISPAISQSIDWYSEGQGRIVEVAGVRIKVRLVSRKGRKARIAISAPPNARFSDLESHGEY
ncbi:MAG: hypothetical protein WDZ59_05660 [Pirellulales bacterium]